MIQSSRALPSASVLLLAGCGKAAVAKLPEGETNLTCAASIGLSP